MLAAEDEPELTLKFPALGLVWPMVRLPPKEEVPPVCTKVPPNAVGWLLMPSAPVVVTLRDPAKSWKVPLLPPEPPMVKVPTLLVPPVWRKVASLLQTGPPPIASLPALMVPALKVYLPGARDWAMVRPVVVRTPPDWTKVP